MPRIKGKGPWLIAAMLVLTACSLGPGLVDEQEGTPMSEKWNKLSPEEERIIVRKGTEAPFSGEYVADHGDGSYVCKRCGAPLFKSDAKFDSGSGWPSFDEALPGAVKELPDPDGRRTEIVCAECGAHLGHVFRGERMTEKNTRHCVNSLSLNFTPAATENSQNRARAYFAGGCFWGVEYHFESVPGVLDAESGYMGGTAKNPTYEQVCAKRTGHAETVRVTYDPTRVDYERLARLFFEIHDPTQLDRQGPDVGDQYRSAVFYANDEQKATAEKLIGLLKAKGYAVVTRVEPAGRFYPAEDYHQDYYEKKGSEPYCHFRTRRFE